MGEEKAPFNSALDLLERLSNILTHITKVKQNLTIDKHIKQALVLDLVKDYYMQSIPLLSLNARVSLKYILDMKQVDATITKNNRVTGEKKPVYSQDVEDKINKAIIDIQSDLQDVGGYFMPPRRKLGKVVGDF